METETKKVKQATQALIELSQIKKDAASTLKGSLQDVSATQKLWHEKNKSGLIKIGVALMVFPEPTPITSIVGSGLVAAGLVQNQIKNRSIYIEDIAKDFRKNMKEIYSCRSEMQL